jgi:hypothetical protein
MSATATWARRMREHGFNLGGEQSGHMILSDFGTTPGDGLIAAPAGARRCWWRQGKTLARGAALLRPAAAAPGERALRRAEPAEG